MFQNLFSLSVSPLNLVLRTLCVYAVVLGLLRIAGRRQIGQLGPTEWVAMLLISNAVQNSMNAGDNSLLGGLISAATLVLASWTISYLTYRSEAISNLIEGKPIVLVVDGKIHWANLKKILLSGPQLRALLMGQGVHEISNLKLVVMDSEGKLIVTRDQSID